MLGQVVEMPLRDDEVARKEEKGTRPETKAKDRIVQKEIKSDAVHRNNACTMLQSSYSTLPSRCSFMTRMG